MATSTRPLLPALATVAAPGTSVSPSVAVPDNCVGLSLKNTGANPAIFGVGVPGGALVGGVSGNTLLAGESVSLPIGTFAVRGVMDQAVLAGSGLIFDATGGATTVEILYQCQIGGV
ncbi:MAG: hypothetical protein KGS10_04495 [Chloroflexi bacterium]|nr:hypothetical protein [Chloroflexota bacterium]